MPGPLPLCSIDNLEKIPFDFVENDEFPELVCSYLKADDTPFNLTGFTITLHMKRRDGSVLIVPATPIDLSLGQFKFSWSPGDLVAGTDQRTEIQFVDGTGKPLTSQIFLIDVRKEIA